MSTLIEKIRSAREQVVTVDQFKFTVRRPTDMEIAELRDKASSMPQSQVLRRFVVGWKNVKELDIIPGGEGMEVAFSTELFMEWVADKPALWGPLSDAITNAYETHVKSLESAEKKPGNG